MKQIKNPKTKLEGRLLRATICFANTYRICPLDRIWWQSTPVDYRVPRVPKLQNTINCLLSAISHDIHTP